MHYCLAVRNLPDTHPDRIYHDFRYGFRVEEDNELFGRLILEINQAGLNWSTILKKEDHFRRAYSGFDIRKVAAYGDEDISRLLSDSGIIRNRKKIEAIIFNANCVLHIQLQYGSFLAWLQFHHSNELAQWITLFRKTFRFTGSEIVREFLVSTGHMPGAHLADCPVAAKQK